MISAVAAGSALLMGLAACGGSSNDADSGSSGGSTTTAAYNAAIGKVFNPSDKKGGTLKLANSGDWDSVDPGDTYYGFSWNFLRNYGRSLLVFKSAPGAEGNSLAPDLAEGLGTPSNDAKTWTYKLRKGIKFEDGTEIKSKDVKYAVARQLDKETLPNGPTYLNDLLDLQGYEGPYKDNDPTMAKFTAVETPDDYTIVFKLSKSFSAFDYIAALPATVPVPAAKDTGTKYKEHPVSSGPYKFEVNEVDKRVVLVRNDQYDPATDPASGRKALPDRIEVELKANAADVDNRLLDGTLDVDIAGTGVQTETQPKILNDPEQKNRADSAPNARLWYSGINSDVAPLDNVHCRKAIMYAADHAGYQRSYGGAEAGGDIATNIMPPQIPGFQKNDQYGFETDKSGNVEKAKQELQQCGKADGFTTNIAYRAERPKEKNTAEALQQAFNKVGIKTELKGFPQGDYSKLYAGKPDYAKANNLGVIIYGWGADWNDGFGFLQQIVDSRTIRPGGGNTNIAVKDPQVDQLLDKALTTTDKTARESLWNDIDKRVMDQAYILPGVWAKGLMYRPERLTNVFVSEAYGMYDYTAMGVQ
ncbi:MAG TPA: ABC transporter substrate-binding protein [Actinophytocola sp.]|uniref:ABC transporter substrate-binding protein n=1 Tax=Actinophytocola sp. TaxID=1872138 RepID=UPI002DB952AA|nr:ABC transporter substrate-binding protein [Actinophytocola sp.]HEU5470871.1 ABC transporter substrate-binding protein [Actinophytocola sp.]